MNNPNPSGYTSTAKLLHWLVAVAVLAQLALGFWMVQLPNTSGVQAQWFNLHKSIGITVGVVILLRLLWRLTHPAPPLPESIPAWQRTTAKIVHWSIYVCLVIIPVSGFIGSSVTKYPIRFFGTPLPRWAAESPAVKEICSRIHFAATVVLLLLIAAHVGKVLKHVLIDRDGTLSRMTWGKAPKAKDSPAGELSRAK
jgi:cytochrome b561